MQAWGMTETSPIASVGRIKSTLDAVLDDDGRADLRTTVGQPSVCVEARIVRPGSDEALPWDGESSGELQVAGPWIAASYYDDPRSPESFTERRMAEDRRRRDDRRARLHPPRRPHEGRHQVRRRVDQLGRARERADGPSRGRRGRRHRRRRTRSGRSGRWPASCSARATRSTKEELLEFLDAAGGEVVAARRRRLRRRDPQDQRRQVLQEGPALQVRGLQLPS